MTDQTCQNDTCTRPVPDTSFICPGCGARLRAALERIPDDVTLPGLVRVDAQNPRAGMRRAIDGGRTVYGIASSLEQAIQRQTRTRQERTEEHGPLTAAETALPYDPAASEVRTVLDGTLTFWAAAISEQRGLDVHDWTIAGLAAFLAGQVEWLRAQTAGADAFDELGSAIRQAERATDRPADRRYAGPCTTLVEPLVACGTDLYAREGRDTVTCPACATEYPLAERRAWLLDLAADRLLPVTELARAVDGLGVPVSRDTVKSWVRREQLVARGHISGWQGRQVAIYRVGDVVALVEAAARRRGALATAG